MRASFNKLIPPLWRRIMMFKHDSEVTLSISHRRAKLRIALAAIAASVSLCPRAHAANGSWLGIGPDGSWTTTANWDGAVVPGNNSGSLGTATDLALFTGTPTQTTIEIDANRNVATLQFGSISLADGVTTAYTIGTATPNFGNALYL